MSRYKVTFGLRKGGFTLTESYISPDFTPENPSASINRLLSLRNTILYDNIEWAGVRIARVPTDPNEVGTERRRSIFRPPGRWNVFGEEPRVIIPRFGDLATEDYKNRPDHARSTLLMHVQYDTDRVAVRYLAWPSDDVLFDEPQSFDPDGNPLWGQLLETYLKYVSSAGWSLRARSRSGQFAPLPIRKWIQSSSEPKVMGVLVDSTPPPAITQGSFVTVQGARRKGTDRTSYNGKYFVAEVNATFATGRFAVYLDGTETGEPASVKLPGTVQRIGYQYFTMAKIVPIKAAAHKRGGSFAQRRGNRKKRVSLDP